jgi:hypothetical protein
MKLRNTFLLSVAVLLASQVAQAAQDVEAARASIFAPVQAAYDFHQAEAAKVQNQMDAIETELRDPALTTERKQTLAVVLAALRVREAAALDRLQAASALAQLKMLDFNASR